MTYEVPSHKSQDYGFTVTACVMFFGFIVVDSCGVMTRLGFNRF